ncbi:MAG: polynucleotide adenylyltransferase PcnB [bacterium]
MTGPTTTPHIIPRAEHNISRRHISPAALSIMQRLRSQGFVAYLAGGGVRDLLLERSPKDFDIVTDAKLRDIKGLFRSCRLIGRRFRIAHVYVHGERTEVCTFRGPVDAESVVEHGHHFETRDGLIVRDNVFGTPEEDAFRRDFTVNALFYNLGDFSVIDYVGGMQDVKDRVIRSIGDPGRRYVEDPVRMIRAIRFAAALDFTMEPATYDAIVEKREHLANATPARMYEEIQKLFFCGKAVKVLELLLATGLFEILFPEFDSRLRESEVDKAWVSRVMRQLDIWRGAGMEVSPELLIALLFGKYHEHLAAAAVSTGMSEFEALGTMTVEHLSRVCARITIPKSIINHVAQIMVTLPRFRKIQGRRVDRFMHRNSFHDAFLYFKLSARHSGENAEELAWWEEHVRT